MTKTYLDGLSNQHINILEKPYQKLPEKEVGGKFDV